MITCTCASQLSLAIYRSIYMLASLKRSDLERDKDITMFISRVFLMGTVALVLVIAFHEAEAAGATRRRAFFVFGDSLVDSGNNNFLATSARGDFPPYGIDYPTHRPTGRFSDGLNLPDLICESMGVEPPLPYLNPDIMNGQNLLLGANFASAGIGILNDTGLQFLNILRIDRQFELFQDYQRRLRSSLGQNQRAQQLVDQALVLMTLGGNDFVNNYFLMPMAPRRRQFALPEYCRFLIAEYKKILKKLYALGARRVIVTGTGPLGCIPAKLALSGSRNGECAPEPQRAAEIYNSLLPKMIQDLNNVLRSDVFIASNAFDMNKDFISNPKQFGFESSKEACCGQGPYNGLGTCNIFSNLCPNRSTYVFWDAFHPSERATRLIVQNMMTGSTKYMNPMNLSTITAMDYRN